MKWRSILVSLAIFLSSALIMGGPLSGKASAAEGDPCKPKTSFLGLPTWYAYLPGELKGVNGKEQCTPLLNCDNANTNKACYKTDGTNIVDASKIWLIALAVVELLLRLSGLLAVGFVVFGGFKYITSQGQPDATKSARNTIINACIGIVIAIIASVSVNFGAKLLQ